MKNNDVNGKKVTQDEIKAIETAVIAIGGELYSFFKISNYSNDEEITKVYNQFKKINGDDTTSMDCCFKVLSDPRLRSIYDSNFFNDLIQQKKKKNNQHYQSKNQIVDGNENIVILLKSLSIPFYTLSTILNSNANLINDNQINGGGINFLIKSHLELIQIIFKNGGIFGFYRGNIIKTIVYPFQKVFVKFPLSQLLNQCFYNNSFIKPIIYKTISEYPSTLLSDFITLSYSTPLINQIKNLFSIGSGSGSIINDVSSISLKKLFYLIGSSIILLSTRRLVLNLIKSFENKLINSRNENPDSKLLKYSQIIYCNPVIQCLFTTLLINPLEILRLQSMVSYLKYSNTLNLITPIQMTINLIKNQKSNLFGYLFNGAPTLYFYLLISNYLKKFNGNNNNNNNNNSNNNNNNNNNIHSLV
ncbi:hypothetical protein ACTA71_000439 [Dictyostelium dimigraforme]